MVSGRVLTIDDEPLALRRLALALSEMPDIEHVGEASGCEEAARQIARLRPDILLLDIRMRDGTGFDVIDRLPADNTPAVIFVSAFEHYAARAFEASVVDYVLKPVEFNRLRCALDRARVKLAASDAGQQLSELRTVVTSLRAAMRERNPPQFETELWIKKNSMGFSRVPVESIDWVGSEDDYIRVHTSSASYLVRGSIRNLEQRIDPTLFARIHRRTLVRLGAVRELRGSRVGTLEIVLYDGKVLPAGRVYARLLRRALTATHCSERPASDSTARMERAWSASGHR